MQSKDASGGWSTLRTPDRKEGETRNDSSDIRGCIRPLHEVHHLVHGEPSTRRGAGCVEQAYKLEGEVLDYEDGNDQRMEKLCNRGQCRKMSGTRVKLMKDGGLVFYRKQQRRRFRIDRRVGEDRHMITAGNLPQGEEHRAHLERGEGSQVGGV
ncbi:hypothetical protein NDU88_003536 [Pleurodeles waltl]|uniref:Uncharacterized protein n=1 Tax=Pleurodeles waltl TaxID=8319 RepID=A0AAV7W6C7_PLEWA|nr:hypothetical protein NDU88_003536 [Pleurodeles waltl]